MAAAARVQRETRWIVALFGLLLPLLAFQGVSAQATSPCSSPEAVQSFERAKALFDEKELDRALASARQALALQERACGSADPSVVDFHVLIGQILTDLKDLDGALDAMLLALKLAEQSGPDHPSVAVISGELGGILKQRGDLEGALRYQQRALRIFEAGGPDRNLEAIQVLSNMGTTLDAMGDLPRALDATRRALQKSVAIYGPDDIRVAQRRRNLGMVLLKLGDLEGALEETGRARHILERVSVPADADLAIALSNLGQILRHKGDLDGALGFLEQARRMDEKTYGPDHPHVALRLHNIAGVLYEKKDLAGASTAIRKALRIDTKANGADQPEVARDNHALAQILLAQGDLDAALKACQTALSIDEVIYGAGHPSIARDSDMMAAILLARGDDEGALRAAQRALKVADDKFTTDVPLVGLYSQRVGQVLQARGDRKGARSHFERAYRILHKTYGPDNPTTRKVAAEIEALRRSRWKTIALYATAMTVVLIVAGLFIARRHSRPGGAPEKTGSEPRSSSSSRGSKGLDQPTLDEWSPVVRETAEDAPLRLGPYRLEERLGAGGMGVVYRAYDERLDRWVAVKLLAPHRIDAVRRERLRREARASARLNHPAIVQVFDFVHTDEIDGIVMELVEGESLFDLLLRGPLELSRGLTLARDIAEALAEAHSKDIVHRDLKSENVIVTPAGHAKVLDFGIAKRLGQTDPSLTNDGAVLGTFRTMSPEQALGHDVDHRSDLFSFGTLLYELFTGLSPFLVANAAATLQRICQHRQLPAREVNSGVPEELSRLIDLLLQKEPQLRPHHARDVAAALARIDLGWISSVDTLPG
jgi:tetratricopeptide (TPR) repeat protein